MKYQYNAITGIEYQGANQAELMTAKHRNKYESDQWLTYLQAKSMDRTVRKGEKGLHCRTFGTDEKTGNKYFKSFVVFNLDQTEPVQQPEQAETATIKVSELAKSMGISFTQL